MLGDNETGNETYIEGLIGGFDILGSEDVAVAVKDNLARFNNITSFSLNNSGDIARLLYHLPRFCRDWDADIFQTTYISPIDLPCKSVVTVHDVSYRKYPQFFSPRDRLVLNTLIPLSIRRADAVLTISNFSKREILNYYPFLEGKVHTILLAPKLNYQKSPHFTETRKVLEKYQIQEPYLLFVGNLQPRKNLRRLIKAYARIQDEIDPVKLVIVGASKWRSTDVFDLVQNLGLVDQLIFPGYIADDDLKILYTQAKAFIFPSLYEGFGLPILEAMVCGTPVVCSNTASMPEVAGEAALYINPYEVDEIAAAIQRILQDNTLAGELINKALTWVQEFSWEKVAKETLAVYKSLLS